MTILKTREYTGYSEASLDDAIEDALQHAKEYSYFKVIETLCSQSPDNTRRYEVILTTISGQ